MSNDKHAYRVDLQWKEGRTGILSSPDFDAPVEVATPPSFPGGVAGKWSPEHLLAASVSSCFMTTFTAIAEFSRLAYEDLQARAVCRLGKVEGKLGVTQIDLQAELVIADPDKKERALRIMEKAEAACLISRCLGAEVHFTPRVTVAALS